MATVKRIAGDYSIRSISPADNVYIDTNTLGINADVRISGNLNVIGSLTEIEVSQTVISDPVITIGSGNDGAYTALGIEVVKDSTSKAGLRWNTIEDQWELSNDNVVWYPIASGGAFSLFDDPNPTLSAPLIATGQQITTSAGDLLLTSASNEVQIDTALKLPVAAQADSETGYTKVYAQDVGSGGTGLYVTSKDSNDEEVRDELISRSKAIIYSIIF